MFGIHECLTRSCDVLLENTKFDSDHVNHCYSDHLEIHIKMKKALRLLLDLEIPFVGKDCSYLPGKLKLD